MPGLPAFFHPGPSPRPGFHQIDAAVWRSVVSCPPAEEIFDLAAALDNIFGSGEGKLLLRALGQQMQHEAKNTMRAGGTRKVGYVSRIPKNLVANLPIYILGLRARVEWRRQGHGRQTLASLLAIGRRMCSLLFASRQADLKL